MDCALARRPVDMLLFFARRPRSGPDEASECFVGGFQGQLRWLFLFLRVAQYAYLGRGLRPIRQGQYVLLKGRDPHVGSKSSVKGGRGLLGKGL
jgi:hypothetical protein